MLSRLQNFSLGMRNIKLTIEYDGNNYFGWQIQRRQKTEDGRQIKTIQQTLEKALSQILQEDIKVIASGRTDAGVHARGQVANFKTTTHLTLREIKNAGNSLLPSDIVIKKVEEVAGNFHSRFSAKSKIYRYQISQGKISCFDRFYYTFIPYKLDIQLMKREARLLLGEHDFASFQGSKRKAKSTIRTIKDIKIRKRGRYIFIDIEANGFLYNMVRNIIGTLVEIARGAISQGSMKSILAARDRRKAGPTADAKGLFLMKVRY